MDSRIKIAICDDEADGIENIEKICFSAGLYAVWYSGYHKDSQRNLREAAGE